MVKQAHVYYRDLGSSPVVLFWLFSLFSNFIFLLIFHHFQSILFAFKFNLFKLIFWILLVYHLYFMNIKKYNKNTFYFFIFQLNQNAPFLGFLRTLFEDLLIKFSTLLTILDFIMIGLDYHKVSRHLSKHFMIAWVFFLETFLNQIHTKSWNMYKN